MAGFRGLKCCVCVMCDERVIAKRRSLYMIGNTKEYGCGMTRSGDTGRTGKAVSSFRASIAIMITGPRRTRISDQKNLQQLPRRRTGLVFLPFFLAGEVGRCMGLYSHTLNRLPDLAILLMIGHPANCARRGLSLSNRGRHIPTGTGDDACTRMTSHST